jgi:hypothetical protein
VSFRKAPGPASIDDNGARESDRLGGTIDSVANKASYSISQALSPAVVVAEFWANRQGESIRIQLLEFEGRALVDVRKYFTDTDGKLQPTKKGISIAVTRLPKLASAIDRAMAKARELGLIAADKEARS